MIVGSLSFFGTVYEDIDEKDFSILFTVEKIYDKLIMFIVEGLIITIGVWLICSRIKSNSSLR